MAEYGPPRNGIIFFFVVLSVATLAALKPAFDSYYDSMYRANVDQRLETYSDLTDVEQAKSRWEAELGSIDDDIAQLSRARPTTIVPQHSEEMNLDPLRGWNQLPQELPPLPEPEPLEEEMISPDDLLEGEGLAPEGEPLPEGAPPEGAPEPEGAPQPRQAPQPDEAPEPREAPPEQPSPGDEPDPEE